jgi:hypothetical protein
MKISDIISYFTKILKLPSYYINQNYASNFENIMYLLILYYVSTSHEYVVGAITFPQCVPLIELNGWEDE